MIFGHQRLLIHSSNLPQCKPQTDFPEGKTIKAPLMYGNMVSQSHRIHRLIIYRGIWCLSVPALAWLLTKPVFYVAPRAAIPTFETWKKGQQRVCIRNKNKPGLNIQSNEIFIRHTLFAGGESVKKMYRSQISLCVPVVPEDRSESAVTFGDARHDQN